MQLTYNNQTPLAGGCFELKDSGVSRFGYAVIEEMNRLGMIVDLSHAGRKTCLDAIKNGVTAVGIIDARPQHSVLFELFSDKGSGTLIRK